MLCPCFAHSQGEFSLARAWKESLLKHTANISFASWKLLRLRGQRVSVSVAVLLAVFGSMTSVGIETVAVLEIELVADALIVPVAL